MAQADDPTVLSYFDSLLRKSDVNLLHEGQWLNDNIIGFWFEYLRSELYEKHSSDICLISPDVTQFIKLADGAELDIFLSPLELSTKGFVFLAVNDHDAADMAGGSHWSLLMYHREKDCYLHYDSSAGSNHHSAKDIAKKIKPYIKTCSTKVHEDGTPQQTNGSDCGVYVVCIVKYLLGEHIDQNFEQSLKTEVTPQNVTRRRHQLRELIDKLAKKDRNVDESS